MNPLFDVPTDWHDHFFTAPANLFWDRVMPAETAGADIPFLLAMLGETSGHALLDIGCGAGRHAHALARAGRAVTGIDSSADAIVRANAAPASGAQFILADIRHLPPLGPFEGAIWMGNGFNYFGAAQTIAALRAVRDQLLPGGRLIIQCFSAAESLFPLNATERALDFPGGTYRTQMRYDAATSRLIAKAELMLDGARSELAYCHHIRTAGEMVGQLATAGFELYGLFGDTGQKAFAPGDPQLLIVAEAA